MGDAGSHVPSTPSSNVAVASGNIGDESEGSTGSRFFLPLRLSNGGNVGGESSGEIGNDEFGRGFKGNIICGGELRYDIKDDAMEEMEEADDVDSVD
ncbi:hypothetical protein HDU97_007583 [Phlyctochytrium planicorne]|nr:hypothetical protein HDU97_007583 [Phlyctochytrium planicorne]